MSGKRLSSNMLYEGLRVFQLLFDWYMTRILGWQTAWLPTRGEIVSSWWLRRGAYSVEQGPGAEIYFTWRRRRVSPVLPEEEGAWESQADQIFTFNYWNKVSVGFPFTISATNSKLNWINLSGQLIAILERAYFSSCNLTTFQDKVR